MSTTATQTFIDPPLIRRQLAEGAAAGPKEVAAVLDVAAEKKGLTPEQTAILLGNDDPELWRETFKLAKKIKLDIYGRRIVLFAPLYVANYCQNDCLYCAFRCTNDDIQRHALDDDELAGEVRALESVGHKRLLMVYGEHPKYGIDYITQTIATAYQTKTADGKGEIRRININAAPMDVDDYRRLKEIGIGTYQVFQETYDPELYARVHPPRTRKADFAWRLYSLHRAQEGLLDDVAIGALFGLGDWRFEVMGLLYHALDMDEKFNVGPHTISFPRLEPAHNTPFTTESAHLVCDEDFKKLVAVIRLMVPYTGMILTAREKPELRREVLEMGCSQIDGGTRIGIGSYAGDDDGNIPDRQQFSIYDNRSLDEVVRDLAAMDYTPSFCTACYREARTGETFMGIAKHGEVGEICQMNAILTFSEFLLDYASAETKRVGFDLIKREIADLDDKRRRMVEAAVKKMTAGERDLYF
ncbi:MAG: [FeFe] hydrogenase H-cluster radical SAM maturase HydG [Candidatus Coatesbacteria bacterium]|nr:[FeFe] hydrogenase H-cluster radical SAM maturase HydG [Candidatus Coatesbacteria bacterium]